MSELAAVAVADAMSFGIDDILRTLPHRYPMLLLDRVDRLEPGVSAEGVKCVTANEPYMAGHFPDHPIMPGVLIVDALAQLAGVMLRARDSRTPAAGPARPAAQGVLASITRMRFVRPVVPGDRLSLAVKLVKSFGATHSVAVEARVEHALVAHGELVLATRS